ncbi:MAG: lytic murein transglycosylase [Pseudomonadales bacterium]
MRSILFTAGVLASTQIFAQENDFTECKARISQRAAADNLPQWIVRDVVADLDIQPRVIELDRSQPEFTQSFGDYLNRRVTTYRVMQGRLLLVQHRSLLENLTEKYGVPGRYLVAFWGLETNFGGYLGNMSTLNSLATLACDQRRSDFFTDELIHAFHILNDNGFSPEDMHGSWAGAMGHTQFMPSSYRRYAVDGDGDGKIDLWNSIPDALTSAANFLQSLGWNREERWGREVKLPDSFPYEEAGRNNRKALGEWRALGVTQTDGTALPEIDMQAAVIVPEGHTGPAFLIYDNFDVIMRWNRSESYALSVGYLADRIGGAGTLDNMPSEDAQIRIADIQLMQEQLNALGYDSGTPDGVMGSQTRSALREYQRNEGLIPDGFPDPGTLSSLGIDGYDE